MKNNNSAVVVGDQWRDRAGEKVTVTLYGFNRVTFLREGYEHPCVLPESFFVREFTRIEPQQFTEWRAANHPLEKTKKLREMINSSREGSQ